MGLMAVVWGSSSWSLWRGELWAQILWNQAGKALPCGKPWQALLLTGEEDFPSGAQEQRECKWHRTAGFLSTDHSLHCPQFAFSHKEKHVALLVGICVSGKYCHAAERGRGPGFWFCEVWGKRTTYFSSFILHIMSSFQLTKIMATSFSVTSSDSISGFWKIWGVRNEAI